MQKKLVKFKCCNTEHVFTYYGEFKMCECGLSGYDAGDGYYTRHINSENLEIIKLEDKE